MRINFLYHIVKGNEHEPRKHTSIAPKSIVFPEVFEFPRKSPNMILIGELVPQCPLVELPNRVVPSESYNNTAFVPPLTSFKSTLYQWFALILAKT